MLVFLVGFETSRTNVSQNGKQGEMKNLGEANAAIAAENAEK